MGWLETLRSGAYGNNGSGYSSEYVDPFTGMSYHATYSGGLASENGSDASSTLVGYVGTDGKPWHPGQQGVIYGVDGAIQSTFLAENAAKREWFDYLPYVIAAVAGASIIGALGPEAAFGAASSGEVGAAAATVEGGEALATTTAIEGAGTTAGAGASLSSIAGVGSKVISIAGAVLGQGAKAGGAKQPYVTAPAPRGLPSTGGPDSMRLTTDEQRLYGPLRNTPARPGVNGAGVALDPLLLAVAGVGALLLLIKK